jgi:hypothetical protein
MTRLKPFCSSLATTSPDWAPRVESDETPAPDEKRTTKEKKGNMRNEELKKGRKMKYEE